MIRARMCFLLEEACDLTCAFSGEESATVTISTIFPVVLMELQVQGLCCLETLKLLLNSENKPQKNVFLTANDTRESASVALNPGAFRHTLFPEAVK